MKMKKLNLRIFLPVLAVLAMFVGAPAFAGTQGGNFEVSPFVGFYWFDNDTGYNDDTVWGGRFGYLFTDNLEAELAVAAVSSELRSSGGDADLLQVQADALYNLTGMGRFVPYLAAGIGVANYDPEVGSAHEYDLLINYGVGARYFFTDYLAARVDLRQPIVFEDTDFNLMATAGLSFFFGVAKQPVQVAAVIPSPPADRDGDGVVDRGDRCPETPTGVMVDARGCPPDADGDGVVDYLDKCPETPDGAVVDAVGCLKDTDRDGLSDWDELKLGTDLNIPDSDGDGLKDGDEVNKFKTNPLNPDTDGGGVNDGLEVNVVRTNPLDPADDVKEVRRIELKVYFDTNSDAVRPEYFSEIEQVADFLREYPEVVGTVEGHTDSLGSADYNQKLSQRRALSVIRVAEERFGVEAGRLTGVGYGGSRPLADNGTEEGRALNRRIEASFTSR